MIYVQIAGARYPARILGRVRDPDWNGRESKAITLQMEFAQAKTLFTDGCPWEIVCVEAEEETVYDNSAFSVAGSVTDHRNGSVTVKMGKPTAEERLAELMAKYGEA